MRLSLSLGLGGVTPATAAARHDRGPRHAAKPRLRLGQLPDAHGFPRLTLCRPPAARAFPLPRLKRKITPPPHPPLTARTCIKTTPIRPLASSRAMLLA